MNKTLKQKSKQLQAKYKELQKVKRCRDCKFSNTEPYYGSDCLIIKHSKIYNEQTGNVILPIYYTRSELNNNGNCRFYSRKWWKFWRAK